MAYLFIDGHNVAHAWPALKLLINKNDIDSACSQLVESVHIIHDIEGIDIAVVFDGQGERPTVENPTQHKSFSVIYSSSDISADGLIEQLVRRVNKPKECTVVTQDNLVTESARSVGAVAITPDDLQDWVQRCQKRSQTLIQHRRPQQKNITTAWDCLDKL